MKKNIQYSNEQWLAKVDRFVADIIIYILDKIKSPHNKKLLPEDES